MMENSFLKNDNRKLKAIKKLKYLFGLSPDLIMD